MHLEIDYPDVERDLNRWMPLMKCLLAIPHYLILIVLFLAAIVAVVIAWFAILVTGRYPRPLFDFVVGVGRWSLRVGAYAFLLVTDRYPPFTLKEEKPVPVGSCCSILLGSSESGQLQHSSKVGDGIDEWGRQVR